MQFYHILFISLLCIQLIACGGSGNGDNQGSLNNSGDDTITVSPSALTFTVQQFDAVPERQIVNINFSGEAVGFRTLTPDATWLYHSTVNREETFFQVEVGVETTELEPGIYEATIRYETGDFERVNVTYWDFKITYIVNESDEIPIILPNTPSDFEVTVLERAAVIGWSKPATLTFNQNTYYKLYWSTQAGFQLDSAQKFQIYGDLHIHLNLTANTPYYYRLTLMQDGLESLPTDELEAIVKESVSAPLMPINGRAYIDKQNVIIKWDGAVNADGFNLYWSETPFTDTADATLIADVTSPFVHDGLMLNTTYYYKLAAKNTFGEGLPSNRLQATPDGSWIKQQGTLYDDFARAMDIDASNNLYVIGETKGDFTNGSIDVNISDPHPFIAKFDNTGNQLWLKQLDFSIERVYFKDIVVDDAGNSYITGYSNGDFATPNSGGWDLIVAKYDTDANLVWKKQFELQRVASGHAIALDSVGNILVASLEKPQTNNDDLYLRKLSNTGDILWETTIATRSNEFNPRIVIDDFDNCLIVGGTFGDLFGDGNNIAGQNTFLAKYDKDGNNLWQKLVHAPDLSLAPNDIATDGTDYIYLSGTVYGTSLSGTVTGSDSEFLMKFDLSGNKLWEQHVGFKITDALVLDDAGNIYIAGSVYPILDAVGHNINVKKYDSSGTLLDERSYITDRFEDGKDIVIDTNNKVFITGHTYGDLQGINKITAINDADFVLIGAGL